MAFHNPYHFVPVKPDQRRDDLAVADFERGNVGHVTHDRFVSETRGKDQIQPVYSGRLVCRLTTEDPIVIGYKRKDSSGNEPSQVSAFALDGQPAIPASTLRGLISSIAEAASNSALRVLENHVLSYRVEMENSLSAIGMIVEVNGENGTTEFRLRPLALPTMQGQRGGAIPLDSRYRKMFPIDKTPPLKVYVGNSHQIRSNSFVGGLPFRSFSLDYPQYCYAKLSPRSWSSDHAVSPDRYQHRKAGEHGPEFLLSQTTTDELPPILESGLSENEQERKLYTRGILRVLGVRDREDIPDTKKHELFIPYPDDVEGLPTFPLSPSAIDRFLELADERTNARKEGPSLPYEPKGTVRNRAPRNANDKCFRLKAGDLVYFRPDSQGDAVEEIALSAIWRRDAGHSHDYFHRISPELQPFHKDRQRLTIAEQLFGFVEQVELLEKIRSDRAQAHALASRLRFSFGLYYPTPNDPHKDDPYEKEVPLKILDSPKPPSPAFYFKHATGKSGYIAKKDLNSRSHIPQGRKFYLHRYSTQRMPWKTNDPEERPQQKSLVQPLRPERIFYFHIDFENLSKRELGLLCYAIRPTENFRHKLGMGKPIGLGKVRIDPVGVFYINRQKRYEQVSLFDADAKRYHGKWILEGEDPVQWPQQYEAEKQANEIRTSTFPPFDDLRKVFRDGMDRDIQQALELLGDPAKVRRPVRTPQVEGVSGKDEEKETYRWFVANDLGSEGNAPQKKFLEPLEESTEHLPILQEHPWSGE